jgi:hypothetical protein
MVKTDTTSLNLQLESLDFDKTKFYIKPPEIDHEGNEKTCEKLYLPDCYKPLGVSFVHIKPEKNEVDIKFSAKILGEQYLQGVHQNTVEAVIEKFKPIIRIPQTLLLEATVREVHISENLDIGSRIRKEKAIQALILGKSNRKFAVQDYTQKNQGIVFKTKLKRNNEHLKYYNKEKDLWRSENEDVFRLLPAKTTHNLPNILRSERQLQNKKSIRDAVRLQKGTKGEVQLQEVLSSNRKPILDLHDDVLKYASEITIFDEYTDFEVAVWERGITGLYADVNCDIDLLLNFAKQTTKNSTFYSNKNKKFGYLTLQQYIIKIVQEFEQKTNKNNGADFGFLDALKEIKNLLKVA